MSVWVMTSPLTIAVALTTDGSRTEHLRISGKLSAAVESGWAAGCWAIAAVASARPSAIGTPRKRRFENIADSLPPSKIPLPPML